MNPEDFTSTELAEQAIDLGLIDEEDAAELTYFDLRAILEEYDAELAMAEAFSY